MEKLVRLLVLLIQFIDILVFMNQYTFSIFTANLPRYKQSSVIMRVRGGGSQLPPALTPKIGPLGVDLNSIADQVKTETKDWKGRIATVKLTVVNRQASVSLVNPTLQSDDTAGENNMTFINLLEIAQQWRSTNQNEPGTLEGTVKEILGNAEAVQCTIDGELASVVRQQIDDGEIEIPEE